MLVSVHLGKHYHKKILIVECVLEHTVGVALAECDILQAFTPVCSCQAHKQQVLFLSQHKLVYLAGRCLVGPGMGFVAGAKGVLATSGRPCRFSDSAMIGDLTGTYTTRHTESCSFPPDQMWELTDRSIPEFYAQFINRNVQ